MRCKNTRPTFIYFLIDVRPETIAAGWSNGKPFYCGKTVELPEVRLRNHKKDARKWHYRPLTGALNDCGEYVAVVTVEIVTPDGDWVARETRWIELLRFSFPDCVNVSAGGVGVPGLVHSQETRERLRNANLGKTLSPETRAKIGIASSRFRHTPESRAKIGAAHRGKKKRPESVEKAAAARRGQKHSPETRAQMSLTRKGRPVSLEARHKISESKKHLSPETRLKLSAAGKKRWANV